MTKKNQGINSAIIHAGRDPKASKMVNVPIYQTSTVVFDKYTDLLEVERCYADISQYKHGDYNYGRNGTKTTFAFEQALASIYGGDVAFTTASGLAAISTALLAFLKSGDHVLISDNCYSPCRALASGMLAGFGVEVTFFDPTIGVKIEELIKSNTRVIWLESPGSLTFEISDVPAITKIARQRNILTMIDNSWASPLLFKAFDHGIDIIVDAITKYIAGHSDLVMGSIIVKAHHHEQIRAATYKLGAVSSPHVAYLAARGLRTLGVRMAQHQKSALAIATWCQDHPKIIEVLYPALPSNPFHDIWKRDFKGANGLFTIVLDRKYSAESISAMVDNLALYSMGYSWGGFESLVLPFTLNGIRSSTSHPHQDKTMIRLHIGLEDAEDLVNDLDAGLARL